MSNSSEMDEEDMEGDDLIRDILPTVVSREEWGALKSKRRKKLKTPVNTIIFSGTETRACYTRAHCIHDLQKHQMEAFDDSMNDIPFNFLIGQDGRVYEVMGWNYQANYNYWSWFWKRDPVEELYEKSIEVAFTGPEGFKPTTSQVRAALGLLIFGIQNNYLLENVDILENSIRGPVFPKNALMSLAGMNGEEKKFSDFTEEEQLDFWNQLLDDDHKMTIEQMRESLVDAERKFDEEDEKLKETVQKEIEENYPWHFKTKK